MWRKRAVNIDRKAGRDCHYHRDLLDRRGQALKTPLFNQDLNDALTFAENDLKANWTSYKERFMEEP